MTKVSASPPNTPIANGVLQAPDCPPKTAGELLRYAARRGCYFLFEDDGVNVEMSVVAPHGWVFVHGGVVIMTHRSESEMFTASIEEILAECLFEQMQKGLRPTSNVRTDSRC